MKISCGDLVRPGTGIYVDQVNLYPLLRSYGHELELTPSRDLGRSPWQRIRGLLRGFTPPTKSSDVLLLMVPPFPFFPRRPVVTLVHDLRWLRTRSKVSRAYREWDLRRTVKKSQHLVCISERTREELARFIPGAEEKSSVAHLGPGLFSEPVLNARPEAGTVLLIGGSPHKRNELAIQALVQSRPAWLKKFVGVSLSSECRDLLDASGMNVEFHDRPSDDKLRDLYLGAESYVFFGVEEGFGLPYIEALAAGCRVVAIDQPLTREILGAAAVLLRDGSVSDLASQLSTVVFPEPVISRRAASKYSWSGFARHIERTLERAVASAGRTS